MKLTSGNILTISIILFLISLSQEAYCTTRNCDAYGLSCLLMGFIGFFLGGACLTWLANPFLIISWIILYTKHYKVSLVLSSIAIIIAMSFLFFKEIIVDEAGHYKEITKYGLGYWLWLLSMIIVFLGNIFLLNKKEEIFSD